MIPGTMVRALCALTMIAVGGAATQCTNPADCGYNGVCTHGSCVCKAPWKGPECQVLDLKPVSKQAGYHQPSTSSWGGSVVTADDGKLYMYAAEMVAHCGIQSWTRNSRIIIASAANASAPFKFEKELFGVFSHEPAAVRDPTSGEYVLFFTTTTLGCGSYGACVPSATCTGMGNGSTCNPGGPTCWTECTDGSTPKICHDMSSEASPNSRFPTYMTYSKHPLGPYSTPVMVYNGSDGGAPVATGDTNMAGVIMSDGSLVGMWRGDRKSSTIKPNVIQYEYGMRAANWRDPSTYEWGYAIAENNIFPGLVGKNETHTCGIEDPTLYLDPTNGVLHAVVHNWNGGGHAASADNGQTWRWYGGNCSANRGPASLDWSRSVWPATFTYNSGETVEPHRRERPHVVVDTHGTVLAVTTALQQGADDYTWTLLQETTAIQY